MAEARPVPSAPWSPLRGRARPRIARRVASVARGLILPLAERIRCGSLSVVEAGVRRVYGSGEPRVEIVIHDPAFWLDVLIGGSVGFGEAFVAGRWSSPDAVGVVRLFLRNAALLGSIESGFATLLRSRDALRNAARKNTPTRSRTNVAAHYDLGNDFFELILDPTLSYSCALFERPEMSLEQASRAKLVMSCDKLALEPGQTLLEIGTGWGALALAAAERGCQVTTTTISRAQHALAGERIRRAGLQQRVTLLDWDWRRLSGRYDRIACIEMIEAVGHRYYPQFFQRLAELSVPGGRVLLQAIAIGDDRFEWAKDRVDFVKKHVFPGTCLPSLEVIEQSAAGAELSLVAVDDLTQHYPPTLRAWRDNLLQHSAALRARGYPESLLRTWEYYLAYCEAGFAERHIRDLQIVLERRS